MSFSVNKKTAHDKFEDIAGNLKNKTNKTSDILKDKTKKLVKSFKNKVHSVADNNQSLSPNNRFKKNTFNENQTLKGKEFSHQSVGDITKIDLSKTSDHVKNTKNFVVLVNGFPARNKMYHVQFENPDKKGDNISLPFMRTDQHGVLHILAQPHFKQNNQIDLQHCDYRPIKFSKRLGFVFKDTQSFNPKNIFYKKKIISKYLDIGMSEHFIRSVVLYSNNGQKKVDVSQNPVIHNWMNAVATDEAIKDDYKAYNTHTERTKKALKYTNYAYWTTMGVGATALITAASAATAGAASVTSLGIGAGIIAAGSAIAGPHHHMKNNHADISRERDSQLSALNTLKAISEQESNNKPKEEDKKDDDDKKQHLETHSFDVEKPQQADIKRRFSDIQSGKIDFEKNI